MGYEYAFLRLIEDWAFSSKTVEINDSEEADLSFNFGNFSQYPDNELEKNENDLLSNTGELECTSDPEPETENTDQNFDQVVTSRQFATSVKSNIACHIWLTFVKSVLPTPRFGQLCLFGQPRFGKLGRFSVNFSLKNTFKRLVTTERQ